MGPTTSGESRWAGRGSDAIFTRLPLVFNETNTDFPSVDCARVHIDAIRRAFNS
jgi:hypothetical protein